MAVTVSGVSTVGKRGTVEIGDESATERSGHQGQSSRRRVKLKSTADCSIQSNIVASRQLARVPNPSANRRCLIMTVNAVRYDSRAGRGVPLSTGRQLEGRTAVRGPAAAALTNRSRGLAAAAAGKGEYIPPSGSAQLGNGGPQRHVWPCGYRDRNVHKRNQTCDKNWQFRLQDNVVGAPK